MPSIIRSPGSVLLALLLASCATAKQEKRAGCVIPTSANVPVAAHPDDRCVHDVACETCVKCHPELVAKFKAAGDWCPEHDVPESQCGICHPEVLVAAPKPPKDADVVWVTRTGEDTDLVAHTASGKVTIFDFYADWCGPCRKVDEHVFALLETRRDLAFRKLNVVSWETPLAKHYLAGVPSLPFTIVVGRDGREVARISGLDLDALDRAISRAAGSETSR